MGHSSASFISPHQAVMNRIRERCGRYRRHQSCEDRYERSLPLRQKQDRQDAFPLHQRAMESGRTNRINNIKTKQQDLGSSKASKQDQPPNGLEKCASSASAILQGENKTETRGNITVEKTGQQVYLPKPSNKETAVGKGSKRSRGSWEFVPEDAIGEPKKAFKALQGKRARKEKRQIDL